MSQKDSGRKWCHGGQWYVQPPDGLPLPINTERGADCVLALFARIAELEAQAKEQGRPQGVKSKKGGDE